MRVLVWVVLAAVLWRPIESAGDELNRGYAELPESPVSAQVCR